MSWWGAILIWVLAFGATWVVNALFEWSLGPLGWFALFLGIGASLTLVTALWWPLLICALVAIGLTKWLADWRQWDLTPGWWFLLFLGLTLGSVVVIFVLLLVLMVITLAGSKEEE